MDWATPQYSTVFMPAGKPWQQWKRPLSPIPLSAKKCPGFLPMFCLCSGVLSHTMRQEAPLFLHSAPGEILHLSPQNTTSPFCPHRGARRIGSGQWEPTLLLRMCRVQKCHLMVQGSMWPLPIWARGPCSSQAAGSKVWAEGEWEGCGPKLLRFPVLCRSWCMLSLCVLLPHHGCWHWQPGVVFLQPLLSKEEHETRKGKKSKFLLLWAVLPHRRMSPPVSIWGLMSLCTYQPFGLQFSFYLLASACTRWLRKQLIQQKLQLLHKGKAKSFNMTAVVLSICSLPAVK